MTEVEWLECTDPMPMLTFLRGKVSDRKLRLFSVACCYRILRSIRKKHSQQEGEVNSSKFHWFIQFAEQYAEGIVDPRTVERHEAYYAYYRTRSDQTILGKTAEIADDVIRADAGQAATSGTRAAGVAAHIAVYGLDNAPPTTAETIAAYRNLKAAEQTTLSCLVRCIFGLAFTTAIIEPAWLTWNNSTVGRIATTICDERGFDRMPILADALEEAGCDNADILNHCRQPGEHARGCWVIDALLQHSHQHNLR